MDPPSDKSVRKAIGYGLFVLSIFGYFWLSSPGDLVVRDDGSISGFTNYLRRELQGSRFWEEQLSFLQSDYIMALEMPARDAERNAQLEEDLKQLGLDEFAELSTAAEREVYSLRKRADEIESAESLRQEEEIRLKVIAAIIQRRNLIVTLSQQ